MPFINSYAAHTPFHFGGGGHPGNYASYPSLTQPPPFFMSPVHPQANAPSFRFTNPTLGMGTTSARVGLKPLKVCNINAANQAEVCAGKSLDCRVLPWQSNIESVTLDQFSQSGKSSFSTTAKIWCSLSARPICASTPHAPPGAAAVQLHWHYRPIRPHSQEFRDQCPACHRQGGGQQMLPRRDDGKGAIRGICGVSCQEQFRMVNWQSFTSSCCIFFIVNSMARKGITSANLFRRSCRVQITGQWIQLCKASLACCRHRAVMSTLCVLITLY